MSAGADKPPLRPHDAAPEPRGHARWAGPLAALLVFIAVGYLLHRELTHFHVRNVIAQLHAISGTTLLVALACATASYAALSLYDVLALTYVRKRPRYLRVLLVSFIANAFGHNLGFAAFTGAAFRLRMYSSARLTATDVATVSGYISITTTLGLAVLVGLSCLLRPDQAAQLLHTERGWALLLGGGLLGGVCTFFAWSCSERLRLEIRGWLLRPPGAPLAAAQIALGTLDLAVNGAVLWVLLPHAANVEFLSFVGIFAVAVAAALITHVPGGLGVFETVLVICLPGVAPDVLLGSLLAYRGVYYLAPLLVATLLFGAEELGAQRARLLQVRRQAAAFIAPLVPSVVAALSFLSGAVLLLSGSTPLIDARLAALARLLPLGTIELAHLAASTIGLALLILARALFRRTRAAYRLACWLLLAGVASSLLKGFDYEEAVLLGLVLAVMVLGRNAFYRRAALLQQRLTPPWVASVIGVIVASIWIGFLAYRHVDYSSELWWTFALDGNAPRMLRASLLVSVLAAAYLLFDRL
ncbi:MAG TPA: lysylphosphatidylglycerol synthase domain-containing protein, partial [Steroidobacteraceae bacterium]|nr:lysylphosphatidylglycerol synthase domain-containing protein [Steroidobacteraceae bacterium]